MPIIPQKRRIFTDGKMEETLKKIRSDLRLAMNGAVATSMREKGMLYRVNFGVDIPRLRAMAKRYAPTAPLAEALWRTDTRELKILATMLYPPADFSRGKADEWASEIPNQEIREQACMNLLQRLGFAHELVSCWTAAEDSTLRATGFWLFGRLAVSPSSVADKIDFQDVVHYAIGDLAKPSVFVRQAALNALKCAGRTNPEIATWILNKLSPFRDAENPMEREIYAALRFEFEYALAKQK
ncbi:MAG: DNA alkylation repair protein [Dysgonamonadaceae bacterium]|jgi:3-methyladenine DNA glycosylase AlkD|nr:DNA alkylation repair protein [Dysgonamonadaceae bacterium]